jgi:hypothetical protein
MDFTGAVARKLAQRSSRRQFFKLLGAGSLGTGLFLTGTEVSLGAIEGCVGCGGGPCNPCVGIGPICDNLPNPAPCKTCVEGGGCGPKCLTSGEWFCCQTGGPRAGCRIRCSECNCPPGCQNPSCHCFVQLPMPCTPRPHSGDRPCACPPLDAPLPSF